MGAELVSALCEGNAGGTVSNERPSPGLSKTAVLGCGGRCTPTVLTRTVRSRLSGNRPAKCLSPAGSEKQGEHEETILLQTQGSPGSGEVFTELELKLSLS